MTSHHNTKITDGDINRSEKTEQGEEEEEQRGSADASVAALEGGAAEGEQLGRVALLAGRGEWAATQEVVAAAQRPQRRLHSAAFVAALHARICCAVEGARRQLLPARGAALPPRTRALADGVLVSRGHVRLDLLVGEHVGDERGGAVPRRRLGGGAGSLLGLGVGAGGEEDEGEEEEQGLRAGRRRQSHLHRGSLNCVGFREQVPLIQIGRAHV